jgi:DNA-binding NarL/FixJ family response regulator
MRSSPHLDLGAPIGRGVLSAEEWRAIEASLGLSPREAQIVKCIFDDRKESAIARWLGLSTPTVHTYIARVYQKLGVHSRIELVIRCVWELRHLPG